MGSASKKVWLEIGVKQLSKTCSLEKQRIRFGIAGSNFEISKTLEAADVPHYSPLVLSSDFEYKTDEWLQKGSLQMFFAIEILNEDSSIRTVGGAKSKFGETLFIFIFFTPFLLYAMLKIGVGLNQILMLMAKPCSDIWCSD